MNRTKFILPQQLELLAQSDWWPKVDEDVVRQEFSPFVNKKIFKVVVPEETTICFYAPPYSTLAKLDERIKPSVATELESGKKINFDNVIILGDFGSGSDVYFGLHYVDTTNLPQVVKEYWINNVDNTTKKKWRVVSDGFDLFSDAIGLKSAS